MSFYADSLPPSPRRWQDDEYHTIRLFAPLPASLRQAWQTYRADLVQQLEAVETDTEHWLQHRRDLLDQAAVLHDQLWPRLEHCHARRPPHPNQAPLPPAAPNAIEIAGASLRTMCLALLRRFGELTLSELHALIHRHGYLVAAPHPVKTLADAMGYEARRGRAERTARATYRARSTRRPRSSARYFDRLPDPLCQRAPDTWWETSPGSTVSDGDRPFPD
jgi:hypothetical protein